MYGIDIKKGVKVFQNDIYFDKRKRKRLKTNFLKIQKSILEGPDFSKKPVLKKEFEAGAFIKSTNTFSSSVLQNLQFIYLNSLKVVI